MNASDTRQSSQRKFDPGHQSGAPSWWRRPIYRFGFHFGLQTVLPWEYGGCRLPTRYSRAFYVGRARHDWQQLAHLLDDLHYRTCDTIMDDFASPSRPRRRVYIVVIGEPPGLYAVARRVELHATYKLDADRKGMYFWWPGAVFLSGVPASPQFRVDAAFYLCFALLHDYYRATWPYHWAACGYAGYVTARVLSSRSTIHLETLRHLLEAAERGEALSLGELLQIGYPPEDSYGPRAYNEMAYYLVHYLHFCARQYPDAWNVVGAALAGRKPEQTRTVRELEHSFGESIEVIEKGYFDWCREQLQLALPSGDGDN